MSGQGLRVVCTDRDTHPSRELATILRTSDDPEFLDALLREDLTADEAQWVHDNGLMVYVERSARRGGSVRPTRVEHGFTMDADPEQINGRGVLWRFQCPTCKRDVPMREHTLRRLVDGVIAAGHVVVDISRLPATLA